MINIEKKINRIKKDALKELGLPNIIIKWDYNNNICFDVDMDKDNYCIRIDKVYLLQYCKIKTDKKMFRILNINSVTKKFKFIICHEIAHYLQYKKYKTWLLSAWCKERPQQGMTEYDYRQLKIEKIADKIALQLLKRIK